MVMCSSLLMLPRFSDALKIIWILSSKMQTDLDKIIQWADNWQTELNVSRCKVMHIAQMHKN